MTDESTTPFPYRLSGEEKRILNDAHIILLRRYVTKIYVDSCAVNGEYLRGHNEQAFAATLGNAVESLLARRAEIMAGDPLSPPDPVNHKRIAYNVGAENERAAIVAWLRARARVNRVAMQEPFTSHARTCDELANEIEAGEHLK